MLLLTIGTALAAIPSTTAYRFSSHPMISGRVVSVNDHQIVVQTDQGEQIPVEVDKRTMAPRDLAPEHVPARSPIMTASPTTADDPARSHSWDTPLSTSSCGQGKSTRSRTARQRTSNTFSGVVQD